MREYIDFMQKPGDDGQAREPPILYIWYGPPIAPGVRRRREDGIHIFKERFYYDEENY